MRVSKSESVPGGRHHVAQYRSLKVGERGPSRTRGFGVDAVEPVSSAPLCRCPAGGEQVPVD